MYRNMLIDCENQCVIIRYGVGVPDPRAQVPLKQHHHPRAGYLELLIQTEPCCPSLPLAPLYFSCHHLTHDIFYVFILLSPMCPI